MLINPLTAAMGAIDLFSEITSHHAKKDKDKEKDSLTQLTSNTYDVNNMSFDDLNAMTLGLMQQGKLSEDDGHNFLKQITAIQQASGITKDTKIDMIQLYQQQIQNSNAETNTKDLASLHRSLDFLNGVKARAGANIPQFV